MNLLVRQLQKVLVFENIVLPGLHEIRGALVRRLLRCHVKVLAVVGTREKDSQDAGQSQRPIPARCHHAGPRWQVRAHTAVRTGHGRAVGLGKGRPRYGKRECIRGRCAGKGTDRAGARSRRRVVQCTHQNQRFHTSPPGRLNSAAMASGHSSTSANIRISWRLAGSRVCTLDIWRIRVGDTPEEGLEVPEVIESLLTLLNRTPVTVG